MSFLKSSTSFYISIMCLILWLFKHCDVDSVFSFTQTEWNCMKNESLKYKRSCCYYLMHNIEYLADIRFNIQLFQGVIIKHLRIKRGFSCRWDSGLKTQTLQHQKTWKFADVLVSLSRGFVNSSSGRRLRVPRAPLIVSSCVWRKVSSCLETFQCLTDLWHSGKLMTPEHDWAVAPLCPGWHKAVFFQFFQCLWRRFETSWCVTAATFRGRRGRRGAALLLPGGRAANVWRVLSLHELTD